MPSISGLNTYNTYNRLLSSRYITQKSIATSAQSETASQIPSFSLNDLRAAICRDLKEKNISLTEFLFYSNSSKDFAGIVSELIKEDPRLVESMPSLKAQSRLLLTLYSLQDVRESSRSQIRFYGLENLLTLQRIKRILS